MPMRGSHVVLRPIDPDRDAKALFALSHEPDGDPSIWTYLPDGPFESVEEYRRSLEAAASSEDPVYFAILGVPDERPLGMCAYMRITPEFGVVEIGHIWFAPELQRTTAASEAIFLLARHVFDDLGYRRLEWKCNSLNAPSMRAADRFGFSFEGTFRNHLVVKGRNRDTAWFSIIAEDWPTIRAGFEAWLRPENFDEAGRQRRSLTELIAGEG
jgi:RimJ/RimL family protein N-acetyltransferase